MRQFGPGAGACCRKERLRNDSRRACVQGVRRCETVLLNQYDWQYRSAMLIGYALVSTDDQDTAAQVAALNAAGCERIFREKASVGLLNRPATERGRASTGLARGNWKTTLL